MVNTRLINNGDCINGDLSKQSSFTGVFISLSKLSQNEVRFVKFSWLQLPMSYFDVLNVEYGINIRCIIHNKICKIIAGRMSSTALIQIWR